MKKVFLLIAFSLQTSAATIHLRPGSSATIQPDTVTEVTCGGGHGASSRVILNPGIFRMPTGNSWIEISKVQYENQNVKSFHYRTSNGFATGDDMTCNFVTCGMNSELTIISPDQVIAWGGTFTRTP